MPARSAATARRWRRPRTSFRRSRPRRNPTSPRSCISKSIPRRSRRPCRSRPRARRRKRADELPRVGSALRQAARRDSVSFQPLCRLPYDAQIGVCLHVDRSLEESEVALHVDVGLQRRQIGQQIRAARIFLVGEEPPCKQFGRHFGDPRPDLKGLVVILGIGYQRTTRTESSKKSTMAARFFCRKPTRATHTIICVGPSASRWLKSGLPICLSSGSNENGATNEARSAFLWTSMAFMVGNGASTTV